MAKPVSTYITLPNDVGNTGKKVWSRSRVVGSDTVHQHVFALERNSLVLGVYSMVSALQSVQASAQNGTSTGFLWIHVPSSVSGKAARIRRLAIRHAVSAATPTMPSMPRIALARFSFTGTASGASVTPDKIDSAYPTQVLDIRSAVTGLTVTVGNPIFHSLVPTAHLAGTAASFAVSPANVDNVIDQFSEEDEWPVIAPGNGLLLYQPDNGTTSDIRRFTVDMLWDEIDTA